MAKHALSLLLKIMLFYVVMLIVAKAIPSDGFVSSIIGLFDFQSASRVTRFILGEPDLDVWESLHFYCDILINTLIGIPVMSAMITAYNGMTRKVNPTGLFGDWFYPHCDVWLRYLRSRFCSGHCSAFCLIIFFSWRRNIFSFHYCLCPGFQSAANHGLLLAHHE
jgi:hypothetical protein